MSAGERHEDLVAAALAVREHAHAPYSRFAVGAAVRAADGRVFVGVNVENASFPLSLCAERAAVAAAVSAGVREIVAVAVATHTDPPTAPCGGCRQVLSEFARDAEVVLVNDQGARRDTTLAALLPQAFRGDSLA